MPTIRSWTCQILQLWLHGIDYVDDVLKTDPGMVRGAVIVGVVVTGGILLISGTNALH